MSGLSEPDTNTELLADFGTGVPPYPKSVVYCRDKLASTIERKIIWMNQVHGDDFFIWTSNLSRSFSDSLPPENGSIPTADILLVDGRENDLTEVSPPAAAVVTADCLPILMGSSSSPVWAAVHAGRRGLEKGIVSKAVDLFEQLGVSSSDIFAIIGPSICADCYEIDIETWQLWKRRSPEFACVADSHRRTLDLRGYAEAQMRCSGVDRVSVSDICTLEDSSWHSYRRDNLCGRQVGYIYYI